MNAESALLLDGQNVRLSVAAAPRAKVEPPPPVASDPTTGELVPRQQEAEHVTPRRDDKRLISGSVVKDRPDICPSPRRCASPDSCTSDDSMNPNYGNIVTPPESPANRVSPGGSPPHIEQLSFEHSEPGRPSSPPRIPCPRQLSASPLPTSKRCASGELAPTTEKVSRSARVSRASHAAGARVPRGAGQCLNRRGRPNKPRLPHAIPPCDHHSQFWIHVDGPQMTAGFSGRHYEPVTRDSGYKSMPARSNASEIKTQSASGPQVTWKVPTASKYPGMISEPLSCPISQEQLAVEVKGIYAGLVTVEAKCINIDAAQAADTRTVLTREQWQALIALHRTLLYEHHDFLMATHHPSATESLKGLGVKYSMPARMWKHGIHAFLEVLRHRRPDSQEHMLSFIYLAYDMMTLLYETVAYFRDTWIECLGDLARYRMAIEEEREPHAQWAGVAASWYTKAADRHPHIGRLYHHLGILERPSLRKFACYGTSLTCVIPFPNAKDSMKTLCEPIVEDEKPVRAPVHATEASLCRLHALMFFESPEDTIQKCFATATSLMLQPANFRWKDCGVPLAITNISALLGYGSCTNQLRAAYDHTIHSKINAMRPSIQSQKIPNFSANAPPVSRSEQETAARILKTAKEITTFAFHMALRCGSDPSSIHDVLPFLHVMLGFLYSLSSVIRSIGPSHTSGLPLHLEDISWGQLATFLNTLVRVEPITARVEQCARTGVWIEPEKEDGNSKKALPEDYSIRGLVWAYEMFCPGWFGNEEDEYGRTIETSTTARSRAERTKYWALRLAFGTNYLWYDSGEKLFSAAPSVGAKQSDLESMSVVSPITQPESTLSSAPAQSTSPSSPRSSSDSDFVHVHKSDATSPRVPSHMPKTQSRTWAAVASGGKKDSIRQKKQKVAEIRGPVQIVDADNMQWEAQ